jgi:predicted MPP superfamily phosphohydrolase
MDKPVPTRRQVLKGMAAMLGGGIGVGGYAFIEPFRLKVTRWRISPKGWPAGFSLTVALIADLHACEPWMAGDRIRRIVARTNALGADVVLLLGDYVVGDRMVRFARGMALAEWAGPLAELKAPLGVHAVLGNHDWWDDQGVQEARNGAPRVRSALEAVGIPVYENDPVRVVKAGQGVWIAGLGDQWAYYNAWPRRGRPPYEGVDDLAGTLAKVTDDSPVVLMAHEPDIFPAVPERVALTVCGHTHGGQVRFLGYSPVVPSRYGQRYAYGHIVEGGRHLIVSGGLGVSGAPLRFGVPPEIVLVELRA